MKYYLILKGKEILTLTTIWTNIKAMFAYQVGNVVVNRALVKCLDFKNINTIQKAVMQKPGGFEATSKGYFYQAARKQDIKLAKRVLNGEKFVPASYALWFYNPQGKQCQKYWWNQPQSGAYKNHCFYAPNNEENCF